MMNGLIHLVVVDLFCRQLSICNPSSNNHDLLNLIPHLITQYHNDMLRSLPRFDEVKDTMFSINIDSALGLDGLTAHSSKFVRILFQETSTMLPNLSSERR